MATRVIGYTIEPTVDGGWLTRELKDIVLHDDAREAWRMCHHSLRLHTYDEPYVLIAETQDGQRIGRVVYRKVAG